MKKTKEQHLEDFVKAYASYGTLQVGTLFWETKDLELTDIAGLIRKEIKTRIKEGDLPKGVYSVRTARHGALYITVDFPKTPTLEPYGIKRQLEYVAQRYNWDASEVQSDYFSQRFICLIQLSVKGRPL